MRSSARTAPASRRCSRSCPARTAPTPAKSSSFGEPVAFAIAPRRPARRHRHDLPGVHPRPRHDDRRERVHRPRARLETLHQLAAARRRDPRDRRQDRPQARPDDPGARSLGRRAAAGRDRAGAVDALAAHRHGRADLGPERGRGRQSRSHHPDPQGRGPVDHLRHPPARGGVPPLRPLHRAARRPLCRLGPGRRHQCRGDHPHDGGTRRRRALRRAADPRAWRASRSRSQGLTRRRTARDPSAIELHRRVAPGPSWRDSRACRARRRRPHRDRARDLRRRPVRSRDDPRRRQGRAAARPPRRHVARHRPRAGRPQDSRRCSSPRHPHQHVHRRAGPR